jgi:serine protease Do
MRTALVALGSLLLLTGTLFAQDRDTKVRNDRTTFQGSKEWVYNDLAQGLRVAKSSGKPLLVVFRCIPCEACQQFDDDVARRDPAIRDLLDEFVCVRIVQANTIDLSHFQYDFDQSFAVILMNPDMTIYGRYGTRSDREESEDISLAGLRKALATALRMHRSFESVRPSLADKQVKPSRYKTPRDYPTLSTRYQPALDYEGKVAQSCMHCHQIREAQRLVYRTQGMPIPNEVLFPYPDPQVLGLKLDPASIAKVERVSPNSPADKAGVKPGDEFVSLAGQPLLSIADVQWVLHNTPAAARVSAEIRRGGESQSLTLTLSEGWRHGDISWRVTSWDLRRMAFGGMRLDSVSAEDRRTAHLPARGLALRVRHVGEFGNHAVAKRAGVQKGDVIVSYDGQDREMTESDLIAHAVQRKKPGDEVSIVVLRGGERKSMTIALQ